MSRSTRPHRLVVAMVAMLGVATAVAQQQTGKSSDFDADTEQFSKFWERALAPHGELYQSLVTQARALGFESSSQSQQRAIEMLRQAIELAPAEPRAYWELGLLHQRRQEWRPCADALSTIFDLEPGFRPEGGASWTFDVELGTCLAQSGRFRPAIQQFKRILARGETHASIHRLIGEAHMAVGELGRAIEFLELAERLDGRASFDASFTLAVAYDRDERHALVHEYLGAALRRDPSLSRLASRTDFIPAADRSYTLGLAYSRKNPAWALIHFRQYLDEAGDTPWRARAQSHSQELARTIEAKLPIEISGSASLDEALTRAAIGAHASALAECVQGSPELLLRVKIRATTRGAGPATPAPGVLVLVDHSFAAETSAVERAVTCLDRVAARIDLPRPSGPAGAHVEVEFPVISTTP